MAGTPSVTINAGVEELYGLSPYDGNIYHNFLVPGTGWSGWFSLGGYSLGLVSAPSTMVNPVANQRDLFVIDKSGNTWHQYLASNESTWSGWLSMGGNIASNPAVTVSTQNGIEEIYGLSPWDGNVYHNYETSAGGSWSGWSSLGGYGLSFTGELTAIYNPVANIRDVFINDKNGVTWHQYLSSSNVWSGWISLGGWVLGTPSVSVHNGIEELYALASDGNIYHQWQNTAGGNWSGWYSLGGAGTIAATPAAIVDSNGTRNLFAIGKDGNVWQNYLATSNQWSGWFPMGNPTSTGSFIVSGSVTAGGSLLSGVTVTLTGTTATGTSVSLSMSTNSSGNYSFFVPAGGTYSVTPSLAACGFSPASLAITGINSNRNQNFAVLPPSFQVSNVTHPNLAPDFAVGDTFHVAISGAVPGQPVFVAQTPGGTTQVGNIGPNGNFSYSMVEQTSNIGSYTQVWSVGSIQLSPALTFLVGQLGSTGTISTTDTGQTTGGYVTGVSTLSVTNGTVSTYSATELNSTAALYYDAQTVATLYQEGTTIVQGVSEVLANSAAGTLSATATAWDDYDLETDHYVVAFFLVGGEYENPLYLGDGSCDDASSDCTIGLGGGVYWLEAAYIYLGSTLAHQTDIPQDGSTNLSDSSLNNFLISAGQTPPNGPMVKYEKVLTAIAPLLFIARSAWANQNPQNPYAYPYPYLLDLFGDTETTPSAGVAERVRTYLLEDTYGHAWVKSNPVTVSETFAYVGGTQSSMPAPNNPSIKGSSGWSTGNGEIDSAGTFDDHYSLQTFKPPVWYLQFYWAWGFLTPSFFPTLPSIPGVNDGTIPGIGPAIPLMIKTKNPATAFTSCADFSTQGIYLSQSYVAVNGETAPASPPGCPNALFAY